MAEEIVLRADLRVDERSIDPRLQHGRRWLGGPDCKARCEQQEAQCGQERSSHAMRLLEDRKNTGSEAGRPDIPVRSTVATVFPFHPITPILARGIERSSSI